MILCLNNFFLAANVSLKLNDALQRFLTDGRDSVNQKKIPFLFSLCSRTTFFFDLFLNFFSDESPVLVPRYGIPL